jgi:STE24 endopeptidase
MHFVEEAWGIVSLLLLLSFGVIAWMRDTASEGEPAIAGCRATSSSCCSTSSPATLVSLPLDLYNQHLELKYGLSVQSWGSWFGDQAKTFALIWIIGGLLLMLLFWVIRKAPRKWWLLSWGFSIPLVLIGIFVTPLH